MYSLRSDFFWTQSCVPCATYVTDQIPGSCFDWSLIEVFIECADGSSAAPSDSIQGIAPECIGCVRTNPRAVSSDSEPGEFFDRQIARPIPPQLTGEYRSLAETINSTILDQNPDVRWEAVVGLEGAKHLLKEAVVHPIRYPQLFTGGGFMHLACHACLCELLFL